MSDQRKRVLQVVGDVVKAKNRKQIVETEEKVMDELGKIENFKTDSYQPLSLAIQLLVMRKQDLASKRQFCINVLLSIAAVTSAIVIGLMQRK